jgi:hydrogenase maturation protease
VFVGGVGQLYQGDLDLGRIVVERLQHEGLAPGVVAEDLHYGAIAVCQRLKELDPNAVVLVGAASRGRPAGTVTRFEVAALAQSSDHLQGAVAEAATGYVSIDLILEVATALGALPEHTVVIEVEPETVAPAAQLSEKGRKAVEEALALVRRELERLPAGRAGR